MNAVASCFDGVGRPFLWHLKNVCVHGGISHTVSKYAGAEFPRAVALVTIVFYAIMQFTADWTRSVVINSRLPKNLGVREGINSSSQKIMHMADLSARDRENSNRLLEWEYQEKRVPFFPQLAMTSVMCHGVAGRIGLKMPELFRFLGILWMNGSISECVIFHLDNIGLKIWGNKVEAPKQKEMGSWGPGRRLAD